MIGRLFYISLFAVITEGILRKWVLPSFSLQIFALKYLFVAFLWIMFFLSDYKNRMRKNDYPYYLVGLLFFTFSVLDIFLSYLSIKIWLFGMIFYMGFAIYILVAPIAIDSYKNLDRFFGYFLFVSIVVYIVGVIQFYLPSSHFLNTYAAEDDDIVAIGGIVRVVSIFNYITGNSTFLSFSVPFVAALGIWEKHFLKKVLLSILLLIGLFDVFATGSRLVVAFVVFSLGLLYLFVIFKGNSLQRKKILLSSIAFVTIIFALFMGNLLNLDSLMLFNERVSGASDNSIGRVFWMVESVVPAFDTAGFVGFGIGSASNVALSLGESVLSIPGITYFYLDQPMGRIVMEIGAVGFFLFMLLNILIFGDLLRKIQRMKNPRLQFFAFVFWTTLIQYVTMMNNVVFNWMGSAHFWLVAGLIIAMSRIDQNEQKAKKRIDG